MENNKTKWDPAIMQVPIAITLWVLTTVSLYVQGNYSEKEYSKTEKLRTSPRAPFSTTITFVLLCHEKSITDIMIASQY